MTDHQLTRILQITARLTIGGPSIHVILLSQYLRDKGYDVQLVSGEIIGDESNMHYFAEAHGVTPLVIPHMARTLNPFQDLIVIWRLYRLIRELEPDIIHTHTTKAGFLGRVAGRLARVPVIIHTFHSHIFDNDHGWLRRRLFLWLERRVSPLSDAIITLTEGLRQELAEVYHITRRGRITVLPLGMELAQFSETSRHGQVFRDQWGISHDAPLIGTVGRLAPVKNHGLFLEAAALISRKVPNARFAIVGDGAERRRLERLANRLGLREVVIFTGWQKAVIPIYSDLDVNVISSIHEGTPVSIIEALASGCPVVATHVGGLPDLLQGGELGQLVAPNDPQALANAIIQTLQDPPDMQPIQTTILDNYAIDRLIHDLDSLYQGLLAKKCPQNQSESESKG